MSPRAEYKTVFLGKTPIGRWLGGTFTKKVSRKKHFLWKLKAWGFDAKIVGALAAKGCRRIVLIVKDDKDTLTTDFQNLLDYGIHEDLGQGKQVFLRECHFLKASESKQGRLL